MIIAAQLLESMVKVPFRKLQISFISFIIFLCVIYHEKQSKVFNLL